jgi:hypothetical protein
LVKFTEPLEEQTRNCTCGLCPSTSLVVKKGSDFWKEYSTVFSQNPWLTSEQLLYSIEYLPFLCNFDILTRHPNINMDIIQAFPDVNWDYNVLLCNESVVITLDMMNHLKYKNINWADVSDKVEKDVVVMYSYLNWDWKIIFKRFNELVYEFPGKLQNDHGYIYSSCIPYTHRVFSGNFDGINTELFPHLTANPNLDIDIILKNTQFDWDYSILHTKKSFNEQCVLDYPFIPWNFSGIIQSGKVSLDTLLLFKERLTQQDLAVIFRICKFESFDKFKSCIKDPMLKINIKDVLEWNPVFKNLSYPDYKLLKENAHFKDVLRPIHIKLITPNDQILNESILSPVEIIDYICNNENVTSEFLEYIYVYSESVKLKTFAYIHPKFNDALFNQIVQHIINANFDIGADYLDYFNHVLVQKNLFHLEGSVAIYNMTTFNYTGVVDYENSVPFYNESGSIDLVYTKHQFYRDDTFIRMFIKRMAAIVKQNVNTLSDEETIEYLQRFTSFIETHFHINYISNL